MFHACDKLKSQKNLTQSRQGAKDRKGRGIRLNKLKSQKNLTQSRQGAKDRKGRGIPLNKLKSQKASRKAAKAQSIAKVEEFLLIN